MNNFLEDNYEVPQKPGNYMKFVSGENKFRILARPIKGWEYWKTMADGTRKPIRKQMDDKIIMSDVEEGEDSVKHFWAMPVWNYKDERIQILEITQKGIQTSIAGLARSKDWGSPLEYDILVIKSGQQLLTKYEVHPVPPKKLDEGIIQLFTDMNINLNALYDGEDPFKSDQVNVDDIPKDLGVSDPLRK